jgi:hypothetical protein
MPETLPLPYVPAGPSTTREDETGGGGSRSSDSGSITRGPAVLTPVCVQADMSRCPMCEALGRRGYALRLQRRLRRL